MEENKKSQRRKGAHNPYYGHHYQYYMSEAEYHARQYIPYGYYTGDIQHYHDQMSQYGYQYPSMEGVPLPPGIPGLGGSTDPLEAVLGPFPCARLQNLPYDSTLEDVLLLLQGLVVIDVILVGHGEAYVIFANPMDYQMGLQRDRQPLGRQFVEISSATREQYYSAIARHIQEQEGGRLTSVMGVMGDEGNRDNSKSRGDGALWSGSGSPAVAAAAAYGDSMAPQHYHPGMPGGSMGMPGRGGMPRPGMPPLQKRTGGGIQVGEHTGYLRMRGLPFSANKEDIFRFFDGYNPIQESIVLTYRNDGRATGEAYVAFASPDDAKRAMDLHRRSMGSRYIELFISNKDEQGRALARFGNR
mmetsp:Transcript_11707/g.22443  ORF Transcript_11707/g.22443 Transcript_11707/m.22443 type:complete len:357 (-) Transcript_11707:211-1281(-)